MLSARTIATQSEKKPERKDAEKFCVGTVLDSGATILMKDGKRVLIREWLS
ncbi:hypothetical protein [Hwanghaeella sp.]|uniref:hypothetical protein n=1 Tax=Hwanghaeella sp. TaxID=2605943 RepID=UPI003CCBD632